MCYRVSFIISVLFLISLQTYSKNIISVYIDGDKRCFKGNGIPDHPTGKFPTRGNPNSIKKQNIKMCIPLKPVKLSKATKIRGAIGIALNGIQFRPTTAGFYDPNAKRKHSQNGDRKWSLDIFGAPGKLGLDINNAHVGPGGLYHYHGIAPSLIKDSLIGYAGDGFEVHYAGNKFSSGYRLKKGIRPSGPGGKYDGTYNEDYEFIFDVNKLDECNGGILNGKFVYFITDSYPFIGRCLWGKVSSDFGRTRH